MTLFGQIVSDDVVEDAAIATLQKWLPTYMSEVERQRGLEIGHYKRPPIGSYTARSDFDKWPEEALPLILIISPGIPDDPMKEGRGVYRAGFDIGVACIVSSTSRIETRRYAQRVGAAVRAVLLQHPSLDMAIGGSIRGIDWRGERNNELDSPDERTIWANRQLFTVEVGEMLTSIGGPTGPDDPDPDANYPDPPTVQPTPSPVLEPIP